MKTLKETGRQLTVFAGHYHIGLSREAGDTPLTVHIAPATLGSLDPEADEYRIKDPRPGWREILIENQKLLETRNCYLQD